MNNNRDDEEDEERTPLITNSETFNATYSQQPFATNSTSLQQPNFESITKSNSAPTKISTNFKFAEIPEHLLITIFQNFHPQDFLPALAATSRVCKSWYQASCHDVLWEAPTKSIHARYKKNPDFLAPFGGVAYLSRYNENITRPINKKLIQLKMTSDTERKGPASNFRAFYMHTRKKMQVEYDKLVNLEAKRLVNCAFLRKVQKDGWKYRVFIFLLILVFGLMFVPMPIIKEGIGTLPDWTWTLFFIPIYLVFLSASMLLLWEVRVYVIAMQIFKRFRVKPLHFTMEDVVRLGVFVLVAALFGCFFILLIINIAFLKKRDMGSSEDGYVYRRHVIPWHAVFAPLYFIFVPLWVAASIFALMALANECRYGGARCNPKQLLGDDRGWLSFGALAAFCTVAFITLLGFALEFPKHFHVAIAFAPYYLLMITNTAIFGRFAVTKIWESGIKCKSKNQREDFFMFANIIVFGVVMIAIGIVVSAAPYPWGPSIGCILFGFVWIQTFAFLYFINAK